MHCAVLRCLAQHSPNAQTGQPALSPMSSVHTHYTAVVCAKKVELAFLFYSMQHVATQYTTSQHAADNKVELIVILFKKV